MYLVDFNPFGAVTDSLMFDWEELTVDSNTTSEVGSLLSLRHHGVTLNVKYHI